MSTNLEVGIVGLPNVGKSTLFNAITKAGAEAANYPFCTIEPNVGVVDVPDARLNVLGEMFKSKKIVPAAMRFVDIAGLVKGASKGEGLGNKFLAHIREVDAVAQVVRCFEDGNITHVEGSIDPLRDIEIINTELCLADMETVEKRQERLVKLLKTGDKKVPVEKAVLDKVMEGLGEAVPAAAPARQRLVHGLHQRGDVLRADDGVAVAAVRAGEHEYRRNDHHACKQRHAGVEKLDLRNGFVEVNLRLHIRAVGDHNAHRNAQREEQLAHCIEQNLQKALHGQPFKVRGDVVEEAL